MSNKIISGLKHAVRHARSGAAPSRVVMTESWTPVNMDDLREVMRRASVAHTRAEMIRHEAKAGLCPTRDALVIMADNVHAVYALVNSMLESAEMRG